MDFQLGPMMETSRYPSGYYNGNVISFAIDPTKNGIFSFLWNFTEGCPICQSMHNFHFSISLDNSMPTYRYNSNYGSSYQNRPYDTSNYASGSPRPNYSYGSNPNYRDGHPHYYSERNVMSFK